MLTRFIVKWNVWFPKIARKSVIYLYVNSEPKIRNDKSYKNGSFTKVEKVLSL